MAHKPPRRRYSDTGSERSGRVFRGDRLQMHLFRVDEKYRSQVLYEQLTAFEEKVQLSFDQFNVDVFYRMFQQLIKKTVVDVRKVKTVGNLRKCYNDLQNVIKCKLLHRHLATTKEEETVVKYFTWFFQFFDYLRELRDNFVARIYTALFRYFYHVGYSSPDREDTLDSAISTPSGLSLCSLDSGYGDLVRQSTSLMDEEQALLSARSDTDFKDTYSARKNLATRNALLLLGKQFHDIKRLYDYSEIEHLAKRLCHLKERTDHMLDIEKSLDKDLLCQDSERYVFHLRVRDIGPENLARLVPDILIKLQKSVWLGRRWLEKDDAKTKDLNAKLEKLTLLENEMNKRYMSLSEEIEQQERDLESNSDILNSLLVREGRSNDISYCIFDLERKCKDLKDQTKELYKERKDMCFKMTQAVKVNDIRVYKQLRPLYQRNKLKRFALERQLATIEFHLHLSEADMEIELEAKPSLIQSTDDTQDKCEEIEQWLDKAKKEKNAIQTALEPIRQDRLVIQEQIQRQHKQKLAPTAKFVGTQSFSSENVVDLSAEFLGLSKVGDPFSIFTTSRGERSHMTPIATPIRTIDTQNTHAPELVASEW